MTTTMRPQPNEALVQITGTMPLSFVREFLQAVRTFEAQDDRHRHACVLSIFLDGRAAGADVPAMTKLIETIEPPFASGAVIFPFPRPMADTDEATGAA